MTKHTALLPVRVKALEWKERPWALARFAASSTVGDYFISEVDSWVQWWIYSGRKSEAATLEEAKAAAKADYEARILSAIEPDLSSSAQEVRAALAELLATVERLDIREGVCCCGDDMQNHAEPMSCGHSPVDAGEYYHGKSIDRARKALASAPPVRSQEDGE